MKKNFKEAYLSFIKNPNEQNLRVMANLTKNLFEASQVFNLATLKGIKDVESLKLATECWVKNSDRALQLGQLLGAIIVLQIEELRNFFDEKIKEEFKKEKPGERKELLKLFLRKENIKKK